MKTREKYNWFWKEKNVTVNKRRNKSHQVARNFYICGRRILEKLSKSVNYQKVRDHCHYTGTYRGAAHSICNLKYDVPNEIPVVFW